MYKNHFHKLELSGIAFTFIIGIILRVAYNWTDGAPWTVIFGSVNSSMWEQCKVFAVPYMCWAVITLAVARPPFKAFFTAKIAGVYIIVFGTLLIYSLLDGMLGNRYMFIEIVVALLFVALGYIVSSNLTVNRNIGVWFVTAIFALILFVASYFCFTYSPPQVGLFLDTVKNIYGVPVSILGGTISV